MRKKNKLVASVLAAILVVAMLIGFLSYIAPVLTVPVEAKSASEIKNELDALEQKKQEAQKELDSLQLELDAHMSEFEKIMAEKAYIDQEISLINQQVVVINQQITAYSKMIADKQDELEEAEKNLEKLQEKNKERLRAMEKNGKLSYWSVIFKANSFTDLLDRLKMIKEIQDDDRRRIQEIGDALEFIANTKTELETERAELVAVQEELDATMVVLQEKQEESNEVIGRMVAKQEDLLALQEKHEESIANIKQNILEKEEEYDEAKDREYKESVQQNPNIGAPSIGADGKEWLKPCSYYYVSSPYGMRWHPVHGGYRMHNGVDLAADSGTPIYAVRNGVVNTAAYEAGGAGNYVFIDHQDGFQTAYMHMTHYIVYPGQYVYAGQVIGYVGSTGASSGPHLHFGVYWNWSAVNPADYINF